METQGFKSVDLRTIVTNAMKGKPINCHTSELFDISPSDIDDDVVIITEEDDELEVIQFARDLAREKFNNVKPDNDGKEVSEDETKNENASSPDAPQE